MMRLKFMLIATLMVVPFQLSASEDRDKSLIIFDSLVIELAAKYCTSPPSGFSKRLKGFELNIQALPNKTSVLKANWFRYECFYQPLKTSSSQ